MIKCLIFDLDGTLFMTREANYHAYKEAFSEVGHALSREAYFNHFGLRADDLFAKVAPQLTKEQAETVRRLKAQYYQENVHLIKPNKALIDFMLSMQQNHQLCLVTTASTVNAEFILEHFSLKEIFDVLIFGEDVKAGKPDPECYLTCVAKCGCKPAECLVFEDSAAGVEAARRAGLNVIEVTAHAS